MAVLAQIKKDQAENPEEPIVIVGHSRGGHIAIEVARALEQQGYEVDFVGAFDPVDMTMFFGDNHSLPTDVGAGAVAWSDQSVGSREEFNRVDWDRDKKINNWEQSDFKATHGGLGGDPSGEKGTTLTLEEDRAGSNSAYDFMVSEATRTGAHFHRQ